MRRVLILVAGLLLTLGAIPAAMAQTTTTAYNGTTSTTPAAPTTVTINGPALAPGQCFNFELTGFLPNSTVSLTYNGVAAGTKAIGSNGAATVIICAVSGGSALGSSLSFAAVGLHLAATAPVVSIDGRTYNGVLGTNTLVASGTGANGAARTATATFSLASSGGGSLVRTGVRIAGFTIVGLGLVAGGLALVTVTRRRRHPGTPTA
jgi:hypothetical protein